MSTKPIGLKRGTVELLPYNKQWAIEFEKAKKQLLSALGNNAKAIEHIGSTSVPGLAAKPVIDISIGVQKMQDSEKYIPLLEDAGFKFIRHSGMNKHLFFAKGPDNNRTHYIHLVRYNGAIWKRDIAFRNFLRAHKKVASNYAHLKKKLQKEYASNRSAYTAAKDAFIASIIKQIKK